MKATDREKERMRKRYLEKREEILAIRASYYKDNKDSINIYKKEYRVKNKSKINEYMKDYSLNRSKSDTSFKLKHNMRSLIIRSLKGFTKKSRTHEILGCSFEEFKSYLESKFEPWMSWDNHGLYNGELNYGWDIDHIIPLSSATTEEEIIRLNHYTNLQPLCSKVNRDIKKDRLDYV